MDSTLVHTRAAPVVGAGMSTWVCPFSVSSLESREIATDVVCEYNIPVTISKIGEMRRLMLCYQYISFLHTSAAAIKLLTG